MFDPQLCSNIKCVMSEKIFFKMMSWCRVEKLLLCCSVNARQEFLYLSLPKHSEKFLLNKVHTVSWLVSQQATVLKCSTSCYSESAEPVNPPEADVWRCGRLCVCWHITALHTGWATQLLLMNSVWAADWFVQPSFEQNTEVYFEMLPLTTVLVPQICQL